MSDETNTRYIDFSGILPIPITQHELKSLDDMFHCAGWKVLMKQKRCEIFTSAKIALDLKTEEIERIMHRALYHSLLDLLTLEKRINEAIPTADTIERKDISKDLYDDDFEFAVPV